MTARKPDDIRIEMIPATPTTRATWRVMLNGLPIYGPDTFGRCVEYAERAEKMIQRR